MKKKRFVVGLTGSIGTGKSTALQAFDKLGASTISLDQIAKEQAKPGGDAYKVILKNFGSCILKGDGSIDRALLGRVIFSDKRAKMGLERATHPLILKEMKELVGRMSGIVVVDVPLLFEKKLQKHFDAIIMIACKPAKQLKRVMARDGLNSKDARRRIAAQWPTAKKIRMADVTIHNDGMKEDLQTKVKDYYLGLQLIHRGLTNGISH